MDEYAIRFFAFLSQAYKWNATEMKQQAMVVSLTQLKDEDRRSVLASLDAQERDIVELLNEDANYDGIDRIKDLMNG